MPRENKTIIINVQIANSMLSRIDDLLKSGVVLTRSEFVRSAIFEKLNRYEHEKKNYVVEEEAA